jgi:hypothetical protein
MAKESPFLRFVQTKNTAITRTHAHTQASAHVAQGSLVCLAQHMEEGAGVVGEEGLVGKGAQVHHLPVTRAGMCKVIQHHCAQNKLSRVAL